LRTEPAQHHYCRPTPAHPHHYQVPIQSIPTHLTNQRKARLEKEAEAVSNWQRTSAQFQTLADFHSWFYADHLCYAGRAARGS